jgi:hypothetical protein
MVGVTSFRVLAGPRDRPQRAPERRGHYDLPRLA